MFFLLNAVSEFIGSGDITVIVATKEHIEELKQYGLSRLTKARGCEYLLLDASLVMEKFMVNGMPDAVCVFNVIGGILKEAAKDGREVRLFGEMISVLSSQGKSAAALRLAHLWNKLQIIHSFSLFCAYPRGSFVEDIEKRSFSEICTMHSLVLPSEKYSELVDHGDQLREIAMLQQKTRAMEQEIKRLRSLEKQKDEFIYLTSHQLKTPLTMVKGYTQILKKYFSNKGQPHTYLTKMRIQLERLTSQINELVDVSRVESNKLTPSP